MCLTVQVCLVVNWFSLKSLVLSVIDDLYLKLKGIWKEGKLELVLIR